MDSLLTLLKSDSPTTHEHWAKILQVAKNGPFQATGKVKDLERSGTFYEIEVNTPEELKGLVAFSSYMETKAAKDYVEGKSSAPPEGPLFEIGDLVEFMLTISLQGYELRQKEEPNAVAPLPFKRVRP